MDFQGEEEGLIKGTEIQFKNSTKMNRATSCDRKLSIATALESTFFALHSLRKLSIRKSRSER